MKLQDPKKEFPPFDVAAGMAQVLLRQGYTEVKTFEPAKPYPVLKWWVSPGAIEGDYQHAPTLRHSCGVCGVRGETSSTQGTAHKSAKIYHCGIPGLMCPKDVAEQYTKAFDAWKARSRKRPVEKVSTETPAHQVRAYGLKSRNELIHEALTEVRSTKNV
jgi:hypothetical protein